jgi:hypothetical protein
MAHTDRRSLPFPPTSEAAAEHYRDGVDLVLSAWRDQIAA